MKTVYQLKTKQIWVIAMVIIGVIITVSVIVIIIKLTVNTQCCGGTSSICFMFRFTLVSIQIVRFNMSSRIKRLEWTTEFAIS